MSGIGKIIAEVLCTGCEDAEGACDWCDGSRVVYHRRIIGTDDVQPVMISAPEHNARIDGPFVSMADALGIATVTP